MLPNDRIQDAFLAGGKPAEAATSGTVAPAAAPAAKGSKRGASKEAPASAGDLDTDLDAYFAQKGSAVVPAPPVEGMTMGGFNCTMSSGSIHFLS